jgi:hypothetical protein
VTAAPLHAIGRRLPASLALIAIASLLACKDSAASRTSGRGGAAAEGGVEMESAGEVVIEAPAERYAGGVVTAGGSVSGTISTASAIAPEAPVSAGKDSALCGAAIVDSSVQQKGTGLGNVVVWLDGVRKGKVIPLERRIELESDHCILIPRVQAALTGGAVNVIAHDDFRQHLRFIAGGETQPRAGVLLGKDEQVIPTELPLKAPGLVIVRDADHPWPRAFVAVFDHPYFAVTKPDGSFTIDQVPAGSYTLVVWHERTGRTEQKITVGAGQSAKVDVKVEQKS